MLRFARLAGTLALHYTLIVRWEESNLRVKLGGPYVDYLAQVPRWLPLGPGKAGGRWCSPSIRPGGWPTPWASMPSPTTPRWWTNPSS